MIGIGLFLHRSTSMLHGQMSVKLSSPCEFLSAETYYDMLEVMGEVENTRREKLIGFLPLILHS